MKKITTILPLHILNDEYKIMLENAIKSIDGFHEDVKLVIVCPSDLKSKIEKLDLSKTLEIEIIGHKEDSGFCNQVNKGIEKCDTEWFTILEVDDEFKPIWLKSMTEYTKTFTDVDVFLPIIKDINVQGDFVGFTNESTWAYGFSAIQGLLDNEILLEFQNYQCSGGLYKTQTIKDNGSLKDNFKLTFTYEFLLRLTHNGVKVMTVPRIGYQHLNLREGSLFWDYKNDETNKLSEDEVKFWIESAKKEFFFKNKRDLIYESA